MLKSTTLRCFLLLVFTSLGYSASATHIMGSDITYRCLGGNQYQVVVTLYRDCSGVSAPTSITVDVNSNCSSTTVSCPRDANLSGQEVSQLCPNVLSTCRNGSYQGVQRYTYVGTFTVAPGCGIYRLSYGDCCRNESNNLQDPNPPSLSFGVETTLNSGAVACNNAPVFTSLPVPYFCVGQPVNYSHGSVDADGDSLVYSLTTPMEEGGFLLAYKAGYNVLTPMNTVSGFGFNQQTGQMSFTPNTQGVYVVDVLVSEYRNGVLIGTTMRDIQIVVINCNNTIPQINGCLTNNNTSGAIITSCNTVRLCPGSTMKFTIGAKDPDGQTLSVTSNIATAIPGATLTSTPIGSGDSANIDFSWTPMPNDTGFRYFTIQVQDNACPIPGTQIITYTISVLPETFAGPDKFYCTAGDPVEVVAIGGSKFSWTPTTGIVGATTDSSRVFAAPSSTTTYIVKSDLVGSCKNQDTVVVFLVPSFSVDITSPDDTICLYSSTSLTATATPSTEGPFTYSWTPATGGIESPTSQTTNVRPITSMYYTVKMVSQAQCAVRDSFRVVIQGIGPRITVIPSTNNVCPGTPVTLNPIVSTVPCGAVNDIQNPCAPNSTTLSKDLGTGTTTATTNCTPYPSSMDGRFQYLYQVSELQALGMGAGAITSIGFNVATKNSVRPFGKFTIKMACTSRTALVASQYVSENFVTVLNPMTYRTVQGWNIHQFDSAYNWDGFSNLLVEICYDTSTTTSSDAVYYTTASAGSVRWGTAALSTGSGCVSIIAQGTLGANRPNTRFGMCVAPISDLTYTWTGSDGSTLPDTSNPTAIVSKNITYQVKVSDGVCEGDTSVNLFIDTSLLMTAGPDTIICNGDSLQLSARFTTPPANTCVAGYFVEQIPYAAITPTGATTSGPSGDDVVSTARTLPFSFRFFCNTVTQYYISTNGFITFSSGQGSGCCLGQAIPVVASPNNLIALCWSDLNTNLGGTIDYFTSGTAPNRVLVIRFNNVRFVTGVGALTGAIHLYEGTNNIEIHIYSQTSAGMTNTLGVENNNGTLAAFPNGYNASSWNVNSPVAFRFVPQTTANSLISSIVWTPSAGLSNPNIVNPKASPSSPTTYSFVATLSNGCVMRDTMNLGIGTFPYSISLAPDSTCPGDTSHITFTGAGASFQWTPASTISSDTAQSPFVWPSTSTTYRVSAVNAMGCRINDTVRVKIMGHQAVTLGPDTSICPYDSLRLAPSGSPYQSYLWSTGDTVSSISTAPQNTNTKDYWVRVFDGKCTYNSDTLTLTKYILSTARVIPSGDTSFCTGSSILLTSSTGFTKYNWNNGSTTPNITVNATGVYTYTATDNHGCVVKALDSTRVTSVQSPTPQITASPNAICVGQGSSVLRVNKETGVIYTWTPGNIQGDTLLISTPGNYTVSGFINGCTGRDTVTIIANIPPNVNLGADINLCSCDTTLNLSTNASGTYIWSTGSTAQSISVNQTGTYAITVTDAFNCVGRDSIEIGIRCLTVDAAVTDPSSGSVLAGKNATLDVVSTSYSGSFSYLWSPSVYLDDSTTKSPFATSVLATTTYLIMVTDQEYGCVAFDTVVLTVVPPGIPPMPDAFSPNGDNMNDIYGPVVSPSLEGVYTIASFRIYNRWGQLVYDNTGYWDGTFSGAEQPVGTYIYYIVLLGPDQNNPSVNVEHKSSGSFTLLR